MNRNDFYEEYDFDSHENKVRIAAVIGTLVVAVVFGVGAFIFLTTATKDWDSGILNLLGNLAFFLLLGLTFACYIPGFMHVSSLIRKTRIIGLIWIFIAGVCGFIFLIIDIVKLCLRKPLFFRWEL